ncbi:hypothetical protein NL676_028174 [Syzygium grande]|nr:hypothetical protein NL676_028174 [Syzygium grande]
MASPRAFVAPPIKGEKDEGEDESEGGDKPTSQRQGSPLPSSLPGLPARCSDRGPPPADLAGAPHVNPRSPSSAPSLAGDRPETGSPRFGKAQDILWYFLILEREY